MRGLRPEHAPGSRQEDSPEWTPLALPDALRATCFLEPGRHQSLRPASPASFSARGLQTLTAHPDLAGLQPSEPCSVLMELPAGGGPHACLGRWVHSLPGNVTRSSAPCCPRAPRQQARTAPRDTAAGRCVTAGGEALLSWTSVLSGHPRPPPHRRTF